MPGDWAPAGDTTAGRPERQDLPRRVDLRFVSVLPRGTRAAGLNAETRQRLRDRRRPMPESPAPRLPDYDELPSAIRGGRSAWGLFGRDDSVGLLSLQTPDRVE